MTKILGTYSVFGHLCAASAARTVVLALALAANAAPNAQAAGRRPATDIAVLSSGPSGIVVEFTPRYAAPGALAPGGAAYTRFDFEASVPAPRTLPGVPELPVRSITLLLSSRENRVEVLSVEATDTSNILVAPVPDLVEGEAGPIATYRPDPGAYTAAGFRPASIATLEDVGAVRGSIFGNLIVSPLRYDPSSRVLRRCTKVVVRITPSGPSAGQAAADPLTAGIAVNDLRRPGDLPAAAARRIAAPASSVLAQGPWLRFAVTEEGMYRLTGAVLAEAGVSASVDPSTIRVFGNGGEELPTDPLDPAPGDLIEIARLVNDAGSAGVLDPQDEVIFYGRGTRGWTYDPATRTSAHTINRYWESAYYWVTWGGVPGKPMAVAASIAGAFAPSSVEGRAFREDDRQNILSSGLSWLGQSFDPGDGITYAVPLPGLVPGSTVRYRVKLGSRASATSSFTISEHGAQLGTAMSIPGTLVGEYFAEQVKFSTASRTAAAIWGESQSLLTLGYGSLSAGGTGFLDWYELLYDRGTVAAGDRFDFRMPDTAVSLSYAVTGFSGTNVRVFDVSRHDSVVLLPSSVRSDTCLVGADGIPGTRRHLAFAGPSGYLAPGTPVSVPNQDLHGDAAAADLLIVAPPALLGAANRLKEYRERPGPERLSVRVVNLDQLYNEFGGGIPSPIAIRNYVKFALETQSPAPRYLLLFGDGDYDYRRIVAPGAMLMPPWETEESYTGIYTYASDDYFAITNATGRVQLGLGRLTARDAAEAETMVDKIIEYETAPLMDPWRTLVTFVADDGLQDVGRDDGLLHVNHAEDVSLYVPGLFDLSKIYLFNYPTEVSASGRRKPQVNQAIRDAVNRGTLVLNYSGHGNPRLWAHEAVFVRESDIPLLANKGKYFLLVAATCNYANFDAINDQSGAEILAAKKDAGAIAGLSATRVVTAFQNQRLNETFFSHLFRQDSLGRMTLDRIGDAIFATKQTRTTDNDLKYFLLGDPALVPGFPKRMVAVDSINGRAADTVVSVYALGRSTVAARLLPDSGAPAYNGSARVTVYDADRLVTIAVSTPLPDEVTYRTSGDILFRGEASVALDRLGASFIIPKDISYGVENGRITVYALNGQVDAAGYTRNIRIAGTDTSAPPDAEGPSVSLFLDSRGFRPGDEVSDSPTLIVDLADSSGVNTSRSGIGHRLEAWIDGQPSSVDLSEYYRSAQDTYTRGEVSYPMGALAAGSHTVRVRAWDTYNNSSTTETQFGVGGAGGLSLSNVLNYPNPFSRSTYFTFEHDQSAPLDVEVKIYTVAGRLINSLPAYAVAGTLVKIPWDGTDREGDIVANGVYLYKVIARTTDGKYSGEALGKLSVAR